MSEGWNILVVDDEPPIRAELRYLLEKDARVGQIAEAGNVTEAVESILSNKPDVLFLDITMPGRSGIELAETLQNLKTPPVVVFVTAFAEYAADAYNLDAIDYVVKPVEDARLSKALDKIEAALGVRRVVHAPRQPLRLTVDRGGKKVFIPVADVCYFEARADFCNAVCAEGTYLINESISSLERRLGSEGFIRVHRSYLVNLEDVHNVEIGSTGLMELMSIKVVPGRMWAATPSSPSITALTWGLLGTMVSTTSQVSPISALVAALAPAATTSSAAALFRLLTVRS